MMSDDLATICELAARLRLPAGWLWEEAEAGRIPSLVAGGKRRFSVEAVRRTLAERAAHPQSEPVAAMEGGANE